MKYLAVALALTALVGAQTPAVSIRSSGAGSLGQIGVPILGYVVGPGPLDVRMIVGTGKGAELGAAVAVPKGSKRLFTPPREHYFLVESTVAEPLAVWQPAKGMAGNALAGAMAHPDMVAFSPRGDAVVLYEKTTDRLQVIEGLPGRPALASRPGVAKCGEPLGFALSDDGAALVAEFADGSALVSLEGDDWKSLPVAYGAKALSFVPNSHNLVLAGAIEKTLSLVTDLDGRPQSSRILAQGLDIDRLAFTKGGEQLLAASVAGGKLWTVDLRSAAVGASPASPAALDMLLPLRDGHTFLLSANGRLALLNVPAEGDSAIASVPVSH